MFKRILLATDGSRLSAKAVSAAVELARAVRATLIAFYAPPAYALPVYGDAALHEAHAARAYADVAARDAARVLGPVGRKAAAAGVPCEALQQTSDTPWQAILAAARAERADLIVMASHGRRGLSSLLIGSETSNVLTHSRIPVLVVR